MMMLGLSGVVNSAQAAEKWNLYTHQYSPLFTTSRGADRLVARVKELTDGEIDIRFHLAGTLQIETSGITQAVSDSVIQMGDDLFYAGNIPIGAVLRLPFLVQSYDEFHKAAEILDPYVEKAYAEKGVTLLASYTYPMQYAWGRVPINSLEDIEGLKIRVAAPEQGEFVRRFGGSSVTMGVAEVTSALDRGMIDGVITAGLGAELWQDLLSYGYLIGLNYNNAYIIVNTSAFEGLSEELQGKIRQAAQEIAQWNLETMRDEDLDIIARLGAGHFTVVDATPEDKAKAAANMSDLWDEWAKARGGDAPEALARIREAVGR